MKRKQLMALLMAASMMLGIVGCGGKDTGSSDTAQTNNNAESVQEAEESSDEGAQNELKVTEDGVTEKGVYPIVPEKITMTALVVQLPWVSEITTNAYTQWLEETTNIHLDMIVVPQEGLQDKLNLMLSTGDYPDLILSGAASSNNDVVKYGMEEQIYIPMNEYIEKYSENLVERWEEMPEIKEGMTAPDGNIYTLPVFEGYVGHASVGFKQWVNQAWLDKVGMDVPTTIDEYYDMLVAFKNEDPNGNGKQDEIPLTGAIGTWAAEPYWFILNAFDYFDYNLLKLKDGVFTPCADTDGFKEGLRFMNKLYKEGLLDPASLTQDGTQLQQLVLNEGDLVGSYSAGHIGMGIDINDRETFDSWTYILPLEGPNGYQGIPVADKQTVNGGPFAITDKCENPAAAFRLADMWFGDHDSYVAQNWSKGKEWEEPTPGAKGVTGYDATFKPIQSEEWNQNGINDSNWAATTALGGEKEAKLYIEFAGDVKDAANYEAYLILATEDYMKYRADADQPMPTWSDPEAANELTNIFTPVSDFVKASMVDFITGAKDIDADWQSYLDGLEGLGYYRYVELTQENYAK